MESIENRLCLECRKTFKNARDLAQHRKLSCAGSGDPIDGAITRAKERGQRISPWVAHIMRVWAARNVKLPNTGTNKGNNPGGVTCLEVGVLPIPCDCAVCHEPAVIFPPEDGSPPTGYCVCPNCSFGPLSAGVAANANEAAA